MNNNSDLKSYLSRLLHIKPSPLRQGKNGPYVFIHINKTAGTSIGNASKRAGYQSYYDDETRQIVAQWFHEDIETFGYSF